MFTLVVDDFGIRYTKCCDVERLLTILCTKYRLTTTAGWTRTQYIGVTLSWDYDNHTVDLSMPGYISCALHRAFSAPPPPRLTSTCPACLDSPSLRCQPAVCCLWCYPCFRLSIWQTTCPEGSWHLIILRLSHRHAIGTLATQQAGYPNDCHISDFKTTI